MARNILPALILVLGVSSPAMAAGDNVVTIAVNKVVVPKSLPGACEVSGSVQQVFRGKAFHPGQAIAIKVPCDSGAPRLVPAVAVISGPDNVMVTAAPILKQSRQGLARLDDSGALIWQVGPTIGHYGPAWGYRVVDGLTLPVN
jgi:hypothetical protein